MNPATAVFFGIAFAVSWLLGYFLTVLLWPSAVSRRFVWAFAPGVGAGMCSLIFFVFRRPMFTLEFALLIFLFALWFFRRQTDSAESRPPGSWRVPILFLALAGAIGLCVAGLMLRMERVPHGYHDGWAIWNAHARLLYRDGQNWRDGILYTFHPDYPLLTPSLTARFWRYAGQEAPEAGALVGIMFAFSGVAVLLLTLSYLRDATIAVLMALVLLSTPNYLEHSTSQYADVPLSFFSLSTIALMCLYSASKTEERGLLVLAGFTAGCAGWTKNEGLVLILAACAALLIPVFWRSPASLRRFAAFSEGLLVPLAVIIFFKITVAPQNDLMQGRSSQELFQKIFDLSRHVTIFKSFADTFWSFGVWTARPIVPLFAFIGLRGADRGAMRSFGWLTSVVILGVVMAAYYFVYLVTPIELQYHLVSSLDRLLIHIWPSFLLVLGLTAKASAHPQSTLQ